MQVHRVQNKPMPASAKEQDTLYIILTEALVDCMPAGVAKYQGQSSQVDLSTQACVAMPAGIWLDGDWVPQISAQTKRVPASARERHATYFCAVCWVAEAAQPAAARIAARELLAFKGLPAYVDHCLSLDSHHIMHVRAWHAAYKHVRMKRGMSLARESFLEEVARLAKDAVELLAREPGEL